MRDDRNVTGAGVLHALNPDSMISFVAEGVAGRGPVQGSMASNRVGPPPPGVFPDPAVFPLNHPDSSYQDPDPPDWQPPGFQDFPPAAEGAFATSAGEGFPERERYGERP